MSCHELVSSLSWNVYYTEIQVLQLYYNYSRENITSSVLTEVFITSFYFDNNKHSEYFSNASKHQPQNIVNTKSVICD